MIGLHWRCLITVVNSRGLEKCGESWVVTPQGNKTKRRGTRVPVRHGGKEKWLRGGPALSSTFL